MHAQLVGAREGAAAAAAREGALARVREAVPRQVRRAREPAHRTQILNSLSIGLQTTNLACDNGTSDRLV